MSGTQQPPVASDVERLVRLETLFGEINEQVKDMRAEQREHAAAIARAVGGAKVLGLLGTLGGLLTLGHTVLGWLPMEHGGR